MTSRVIRKLEEIIPSSSTASTLGTVNRVIHNFIPSISTMKFAAACSLALVASASAFAPAPDASVSYSSDIF
jgi:hypothetical protein